MEWLLNALRELKGWQTGALAVVMLASFGATYGIYTVIESTGSQSLGENQRLIPVQMGNLSNDVSISGSIEFPIKETLYFGTTGTVAEVLVTEGQEVTKGQALVSLDPETISSLQKSVAQARISVMQAEQALEQANDSSLELAQAESSVADAQLAFETAVEELDNLLKPESRLVAEAESRLASARLTLQDAQESLDELVTPDAKLVAEAETAVIQARIALEDAQDAVGKDLVEAVTDLDAVARDLNASRQELEVEREDDALSDAQEAYDDEIADYADLFDKWWGIILTDDEKTQDPDTIFANMGFDPSALEEDDYEIFPGGKFGNDASTRWNELKIYAWLELHPSSAASVLTMTCGKEEKLRAGEICMERIFDEAWDELKASRDSLRNVTTQTERSLANAETSVARLEDQLVEAQKLVDRLSEGGAQAERLAKNLVVARETLTNTEDDLRDLLEPDSVEVESRRNQVALAVANVAQAEEDLAELLAPKDSEILSKKNRVAVAQAALAKAERDLANLIARQDLDIALKETELADAQATLKGGLTRLENSNLVAPFDGYVVAINVERGEELEEIDPIIEVLDRGVVRVDGSVDEIDVLSLQVGSQATVTMDALSGRNLTGVVSRISSAGSNQSGVVTFAVEVDIQVPDGVILQEGMTAVASVGVGQISGLLVPNQAIQGTFDAPQVVVMNGRGAESRPVLLGDSDGFWTVVESGLSEGEQVVMEVQDAQTQQVGFGGGFRGSGGGGGGSTRVVVPR